MSTMSNNQYMVMLALRKTSHQSVYGKAIADRAHVISTPEELAAMEKEIRESYNDNPRIMSEILPPEAMQLLNLKIVNHA